MKRLILAALVAAIPAAAPAMSPERPAADLVAMSTFVDTYCTGIHMNRAAARAAFQAAGGTPDWNEAPFNRTLVRLRIGVLVGNPSASCAQFFEDFGPDGLRQPGLIERDTQP
jgi:hypothetical protein